MKSLFVSAVICLWVVGCGQASGSPGKSSTDVQRTNLTFSCSGVVQPKGPGGPSREVELTETKKDKDQWILSAELETGWVATARWDHELDTIYLSVDQGNISRLFATSRVPTEDHNDSMASITLESGKRIYVSCDFIEFRPQ